MMPTSIAICTPERYCGRVRANSAITIGATRAKIAPSIPSKPQPRPLAQAMCQCVRMTRSCCAALR
jgi:hypothetical protein